MLDLALLRAEPARVKAALARRGVSAEAVDAAVDLDRRWCARREVRQALRTRRRRISDEVARRRTEGPPPADAEAPDLVRAGRRAARDLKAVKDAMRDLAARREAALLALPNLPGTDVPDTPPEPDPSGPPWPEAFPPLPHWDLAEMLHLAQPAAGAGSGFLLWRGEGARLVRGLVRFMLDVHTKKGGREEVLAPPVATRQALTASAHLPTLEGMLYEVGETSGEKDLFLAPRAEPHLATLYAGEVLEADRLPVRLVAATTALRRAPHGGGAAGRGLLRLGAFPTVEVYSFCRPEESDAELQAAVAGAETILERLGVPHRRRVQGAAELSHAAARTVSLDVWCPGLPAEEATDERGGSPYPPRDTHGERGGCGDPPRESEGVARGRWVEVAALSSFTDYQARRAGTAFRGADGRTRLVHTVGGAAVAVPRLLAALLETGQQADGSVRLSPALEPYVGAAVLGER
jgi:seryl-tRNA synthetase